MKIRWVLAVMCAFLLAAIVTVRADDTAATTKKASSGAKMRLVQPWSKMTDLSDEQKEKIKEIHTKANDDIKVIRDKEQSDIMALLSDDQKSEVTKLMADAKGGKKTKASDNSKADAPKPDEAK